MNDFFVITLITQSISAVLIAWLLLHFAKIYQQKYLYYWSYSFFCLTAYLFGAQFGLIMIGLEINNLSVVRMANLFTLSVFGYLQIVFLVIGTLSLVKGTIISNKTIFKWLVFCLIIAALVTSYKNWTADAGYLRYLVRVGVRYFGAGVTFIATAVYIMRHDDTQLLGKKLVTISFMVYGLEMIFLSALTLQNYLYDGSSLLNILVPYHGLFELLVYPMIGISLVMWLLEVERHRVQQSLIKLQNINQTDTLTSLPNQAALQKHLNNWKQSPHSIDRLTLALLGIDKMHRINDAAGIKRGDELIITLAKRIGFHCSDNYRFYCRLHGDVFAVLVDGAGNEQLKKLRYLRTSLSKPIWVDNKKYHLEISAGLVEIMSNSSFEQVLHHANLALQSAKSNSNKRWQVYDSHKHTVNNPDLTFENELRDAVSEDQFEMYFQPIWSADDNINYFEALIRWNHPIKGLLSPVSFLFLIHQLGLSVKMDYWMIKKAIKKVRMWQKINPNTAKISINITAETVQSTHLTEFIGARLDEFGVDASSIILEITENTAINNIESGKNTLKELKNLGLKIAVDDFGTGYSSLNYLTSLPADIIKFDQSFAQDDHKQQIILESLVPMCRRLEKSVVIEGVETKQHYHRLKDLNFDGYQGYYLSKPINEEDAIKLIKVSRR